MNTNDLKEELSILEEFLDQKEVHIFYQEPAMLIDFFNHCQVTDLATIREWSQHLHDYFTRTLEHGFRSAANRQNLSGIQ